MSTTSEHERVVATRETEKSAIGQRMGDGRWPSLAPSQF